MLRRLRLLVPLLVVLAAAAVMSAGSTAQGSVLAQAAGACSKGNVRAYGYSYLTWLWVYRTSCSTGRYVARHHGHVAGWKCTKKILDKISFQYDAQVTCTSRGRQVSWKYTQDT